MKSLLAAALICSSLLPGISQAGPNDVSRLDVTPYSAPQKAVYDFEFANSGDLRAALNNVKVHVKTLQELGNPPFKIVLVLHGNELNAVSRLNQKLFPDVYGKLKEISEMGVQIHVCAAAAKVRGYQPDDFYDVVTVVPAALTDIAKLEGEGYSYIKLALPVRVTRTDLLQHPELSAQ